MHASLWILIGPNGILSLPLMSVRMQPPYADCQEPRWKLHGSLLSAFVPVSVLNISWEDLCVQERSKTFFFFFLVPPFWYGFRWVYVSLWEQAELSWLCQEGCSGKTGTPDLSENAVLLYFWFYFVSLNVSTLETQNYSNCEEKLFKQWKSHNGK